MVQFMASVWALSQTLPNRRFVLNLHRNRHEFLRSFCASIMAGQCTLMPPNRQPQTLDDLEAAYPDSYRTGEEDAVLAAPYQTADADQGQKIPQIPWQQRCVIAFTSGSTGNPSATIKTWQTLVAATQANCAAMLEDWTGPANVLATVPAQHMWGLETSVLMPLFANLAISEANPLYPQDIVSALCDMPEPRMLVSSPLHLRTLMSSALPLPKLARIFTATAPLSQSLAVEFEAYYQAPVLDVFGSSESGIIAVRNTAREELWRLSAPFHMQVVEQKTRVSAAHLAGPVMLADKVELVGTHQFRWLARENDQVNVAGKKTSLADLNRRLLAIEGVRDGLIFMPAESSQRLAAVIVAPGLVAADIRQALLRAVDPVFIPRPIVFVAALPRNETGKLPLKAVQAILTARKAKDERQDQ